MPLPVIGAELTGLAERTGFRLVAVAIVSVIGAGVGRVTHQSTGVGVSVWPSALPVSKANPSAAIADDLIAFIVLLPVGDFRAAFPFPERYHRGIGGIRRPD
jgi:hypothetical protein